MSYDTTKPINIFEKFEVKFGWCLAPKSFIPLDNETQWSIKEDGKLHFIVEEEQLTASSDEFCYSVDGSYPGHFCFHFTEEDDKLPFLFEQIGNFIAATKNCN